MSNELTAFAHRLEQVTDPDALRRIVTAGGRAGKEAAEDVARRDLGGDRAFSGLRRKVPLNATARNEGDSLVRIGFSPAGLWMLAEKGRTKSGQIWRRGQRTTKSGRVVSFRGKRSSATSFAEGEHAPAVLTPYGPRARSSYKRSRGLNTFTDAVKQAQREVPKAAAKRFTQEVAKVVT